MSKKNLDQICVLAFGLTQKNPLQEHSCVVLNCVLTAMIHFRQNTMTMIKSKVTC